jgi:hypothetical protein
MDRSRERGADYGQLWQPGRGFADAADFPLPDSTAIDMSGIQTASSSRRGSMAPSALYSQLDKQMMGIKSTKRRSKSGVYNVRALDAIVGLAASGYFNPSPKKRKRVVPTQTALGFINVPSCAPTKSKRKRYY